MIKLAAQLEPFVMKICGYYFKRGQVEFFVDVIYVFAFPLIAFPLWGGAVLESGQQLLDHLELTPKKKEEDKMD